MDGGWKKDCEGYPPRSVKINRFPGQKNRVRGSKKQGAAPQEGLAGSKKQG